MPSDAVASSGLAVEKSPSLMEDARSPALFCNVRGLLVTFEGRIYQFDILSTCGKFMKQAKSVDVPLL